MQQVRRTIPLGFTAEAVQEGAHVCYIYNDEHERRQIMGKYIESGLLAGEKVLCLVDLMTPSETLRYLEEMGIDVSSQSRGLTIFEAAPVYCLTGSFHPDKMLNLIRGFYRKAVFEEGYPGTRGAGEMSWCLADEKVKEEDVIEYEARINDLLLDYPSTIFCQYDARLFNGQTIMDVLSVHPLMIVRGQLVKNPYYVVPEVFLNEYRARKSMD